MARVLLRLTLLFVAMTALVPAALAQDSCRAEFTLVGKPDLRWYLADQPEANPRLTACPEQTVVFTLMTEGSTPHDFVIRAPDAPSATAAFTEGEEPTIYAWHTPHEGSFTYICTIHGPVMSGTIDVAAQSAPPAMGETNGTPAAGAVFVIGAGAAAAILWMRRDTRT